MRGFTMVELMITIVIAAILTAIAIPSFRNIILSNRLTSTANDIVSALNVARMEAIKLNAPVQFCSTSSNGSDTLGGSSGCGTAGTAVYMLQNGSTTPTLVRAAVPGLASVAQTQVQLKTINPVRYSGQGLGYAPGGTAPLDNVTVADICTSSLSSNNHRVITISAGSVLVTTTSTGSCP